MAVSVAAVQFRRTTPDQNMTRNQSGGDECRFVWRLRVTAAKITPRKDSNAQTRDRTRDKTDVPPAVSPMSQTPSKVHKGEA
jgi:hypothetical protein